MTQEFIRIRGKGLYVETHGPDAAPPLLYLHGGPGESCFDFCYHQSKRLGTDIWLIAIDQRGVCRSEALSQTDNFGVEDIILDCEALRKHLGIVK